MSEPSHAREPGPGVGAGEIYPPLSRSEGGRGGGGRTGTSTKVQRGSGLGVADTRQAALRPRSVLASLRSAVVPVLLLALVGGAGGALYGSITPPESEASADFLLSATVDETGGEPTGGVSDRDVATQAQLLGGQVVRVAAEEAAGTGLEDARVTSSSDSDIITVTATAPDEGAVITALQAYVTSYLDLLAGQQQVELQAQLDIAQSTLAAAQEQTTALDDAVASAPDEQQGIVLSQQNASRTSIAEDERDAQVRSARLQSALDSLPINIRQLAVDEVPVRSVGLVLWQWAALGVVLGAALGVVVALRLAERRRA